jgi:glycosyltransferase involved in cell wall biosynthesis
MAGAMVELAQSPALRRKLGKAGRSRVLKEFDWERKIDRILEIYARAARSPSDASRLSA